MQPQHVAAQRSSCELIDVMASHNGRLKVEPYHMNRVSCMHVLGNTQVSLTSAHGRATHIAAQRPSDRNRRPRCPRASNSSQRSALLLQSQRVQVARQTKNTLLFSPSPSRLSPYTQASTSKPCAYSDTGQAFAPVLTLATISSISAILILPTFHIACSSAGATLNIGGA
jgi:hypothetical protein